MHIRELFPDVISEDLDLPYSAFYEHFTIFSESLANQGISGQIKEKQNNDKSIIHLPRQEVAFLEKARKIKGCGSLREDFYTRFIPKF